MLELRGAQHQLGSYSDFSGSAEARVAISEQELNAGNEAVREHRTINECIAEDAKHPMLVCNGIKIMRS